MGGRAWIHAEGSVALFEHGKAWPARPGGRPAAAPGRAGGRAAPAARGRHAADAPTAGRAAERPRGRPPAAPSREERPAAPDRRPDRGAPTGPRASPRGQPGRPRRRRNEVDPRGTGSRRTSAAPTHTRADDLADRDTSDADGGLSRRAASAHVTHRQTAEKERHRHKRGSVTPAPNSRETNGRGPRSRPRTDGPPCRRRRRKPRTRAAAAPPPYAPETPTPHRQHPQPHQPHKKPAPGTGAAARGRPGTPEAGPRGKVAGGLGLALDVPGTDESPRRRADQGRPCSWLRESRSGSGNSLSPDGGPRSSSWCGAGGCEVEVGVHVEAGSTVGVDVGPEQQGQGALLAVTDAVVEPRCL